VAGKTVPAGNLFKSHHQLKEVGELLFFQGLGWRCGQLVHYQEFGEAYPVDAQLGFEAFQDAAVQGGELGHELDIVADSWHVDHFIGI
jgi:hypothetical protein